MLKDLVDSLPALPDVQSVSAATLLDTARDLHRFESIIAGLKFHYAAEVVDRHLKAPIQSPEALPTRDPWRAAEAEFGAALNLAPSTAAATLRLGRDLVERLPKVLKALEAGSIDVAQARLISEATRNVDPKVTAPVQDRVLEKATDRLRPLLGRKLRGHIDKIIAEVDEDGLRRRREQAQRDRKVWVDTGRDGMALLHGRLPAADGMFLTNRLAEMAKRVCSDDPRSFNARRADALVALSRGESELKCLCSNSDCPFPGTTGDTRQPLVHIITSEETLAGGKAPGWIDGFGIIDAALSRELARNAKLRPLVDPSATREFSTTNELKYRPNQALADWIRANHGWCQFPGCNQPAWASDLDHRESFNHENPAQGGKTRARDLAPFCRNHHNAKTFGGWTMAKGINGEPLLTSPAGKRYDCTPTGPITLITNVEYLPTATGTAPPTRLRDRNAQRAYCVRRERRQQREQRESEQEELLDGLIRRHTR